MCTSSGLAGWKSLSDGCSGTVGQHGIDDHNVRSPLSAIRVVRTRCRGHRRCACRADTTLTFGYDFRKRTALTCCDVGIAQDVEGAKRLRRVTCILAMSMSFKIGVDDGSSALRDITNALSTGNWNDQPSRPNSLGAWSTHCARVANLLLSDRCRCLPLPSPCEHLGRDPPYLAMSPGGVVAEVSAGVLRTSTSGCAAITPEPSGSGGD